MAKQCPAGEMATDRPEAAALGARGLSVKGQETDKERLQGHPQHSSSW